MRKFLVLISAICLVIIFTSFGGNNFNENKENEKKDIESTKEYKTVKIGDQVWMAENLNVKNFRNGDTIPHVKTDKEWYEAGVEGKPAWCYYDNDPENGKRYRKLYNWYAVNDLRGLAPEGWHVASYNEWKELEMALGMSQAEADNIFYRRTNEGSKLAGNGGLWPDGTLKNDTEFGTSGFTALPGGGRDSGGTFGIIGGYGSWWSSTESSSTYAWTRGLYYNNSGVYSLPLSKENGFSVRCLRD